MVVYRPHIYGIYNLCHQKSNLYITKIVEALMMILGAHRLRRFSTLIFRSPSKRTDYVLRSMMLSTF